MGFLLGESGNDRKINGTLVNVEFARIYKDIVENLLEDLFVQAHSPLLQLADGFVVSLNSWLNGEINIFLLHMFLEKCCKIRQNWVEISNALVFYFQFALLQEGTVKHPCVHQKHLS